MEIMVHSFLWVMQDACLYIYISYTYIYIYVYHHQPWGSIHPGPTRSQGDEVATCSGRKCRRGTLLRTSSATIPTGPQRTRAVGFRQGETRPPKLLQALPVEDVLTSPKVCKSTKVLTLNPTPFIPNDLSLTPKRSTEGPPCRLHCRRTRDQRRPIKLKI